VLCADETGHDEKHRKKNQKLTSKMACMRQWKAWLS